MPLLVNPPTFVSVDDFKAEPIDYDISGYTDAQLLSMLVSAAGEIRSIIRRQMLAQERTLRFYGEGSNRLLLNASPVLYVKRVVLVQPGSTGVNIPLEQLLIDYPDGGLAEFTPLVWQTGMSVVFPRELPVDVTLASGYGYSVATAPAWNAAASSGTIPSGTYNVAVTTRTMYGETVAAAAQEAIDGGLTLAVTPVLGAYLYRAYVSDATYNTALSGAIEAGATVLPVDDESGKAAGSRWLLGAGATAEIVTIASTTTGSVSLANPTAIAHAEGEALIPVPTAVAESPFSTYGAQQLTIALAATTPSNGIFPDELPVVDTSAPETPQAFKDATRLLVLSRIYEQNNLANRGISQTRSTRKAVSFRSTEGTSGRGTPLMYQQATEILAPFRLSGVF